MADNYDTMTRWNDWVAKAEKNNFTGESIFIQNKRGRKFNRKQLSKVTGISRSTLNDQTSEIYKALNSLEEKLTDDGIVIASTDIVEQQIAAQQASMSKSDLQDQVKQLEEKLAFERTSRLELEQLAKKKGYWEESLDDLCKILPK